jgi:hypothetical protein
MALGQPWGHRFWYRPPANAPRAARRLPLRPPHHAPPPPGLPLPGPRPMRLPVSASSSFSPVATPADAAHAQRPFRGLCGRIYDGDTAQGKRGTGVQRSLVSMTGLPPPYTGAQASVFGTFGGHDQHTGTRTPSIPFLVCEIEHPNTSYLYSDMI